jgi:hypothetical protein
MKLNETAAFSQPVLRPGVQDWTHGSLDCELSIEEAPEAGTVRMSGRLTLDQPAIRDLIASGKLACGVVVTCLETCYSLMHRTGLDPWQIDLDRGSVRGTVMIRPVVFTLQAPVRLPDSEVHPEFDESSLTVGPFQLVAFGPELRFEAGLEKLIPMESVFKIVPDERITEPQFQLGTETQSVEIRVSMRLFDDIAKLRSNALARELLLSSLYLPCIMKLLAQAAGEQREELRWYRALQASCRQHGIELEGADSVEIPDKAQVLLGYPLGRLCSTVEALAK